MRVLIAEDEPKVANSVANAVRHIGFVAEIANNGEDAWFKGSTEDYAAIVLDLGLPKLDGLTVLTRWRSEGRKTPVLILSARGTWAERVDGIDHGADDYLPKPFVMEELLARLKALVRRSIGQANHVVTSGHLALDTKTATAKLGANVLELTVLEFRLLHHLAVHADRYCSKEELADELYAVNHGQDANAIEALVSRLRRKTGSDLVESRRGFGYRLKASGGEK